MNIFSHINSFMILAITLSGFCIYAILFSFSKFYSFKNKTKEEILTEVKNKGSIVEKMNESKILLEFSEKLPKTNLDMLFNRSKNPWNLTKSTFQALRFGGLLLGLLLSFVVLPFSFKNGMLFVVVGILSYWYPYYYYKAIGDEREAEWSKMYEFIWVLKNNLTLYDPAKAFINTKVYIENHGSYNKELIQGFSDFYKYWSSDKINIYIVDHYSFSIPREITQIVFNMHKTGDFPEDSLNSLRQFIINQQDLTVERTLSSVAGKATIYSLPFLMVSVILALMVPMAMQLSKLM